MVLSLRQTTESPSVFIENTFNLCEEVTWLQIPREVIGYEGFRPHRACNS